VHPSGLAPGHAGQLQTRPAVQVARGAEVALPRGAGGNGLAAELALDLLGLAAALAGGAAVRVQLWQRHRYEHPQPLVSIGTTGGRVVDMRWFSYQMSECGHGSLVTACTGAATWLVASRLGAAQVMSQPAHKACEHVLARRRD